MEVFYRLFDGEKEVALVDEEPKKDIEYDNPNEPTITYYYSDRVGGGFTLAKGDRYEEVFIEFLEEEDDCSLVRVDGVEMLLFKNRRSGVNFYYEKNIRW